MVTSGFGAEVDILTVCTGMYGITSVAYFMFREDLSLVHHDRAVPETVAT